MNLRFYIIYGSIIFLSLSLNSLLWSKETKRVSTFSHILIDQIDKNLKELNKSFKSINSDDQSSHKNDYYLKKIRIKISPSITLGLPGIIDLKIIPYLELHVTPKKNN